MSEKQSVYDELNYKADIVDIREISFGERARADYGDITQLAASFDEVGLIQPLAVKELEPVEGITEKYLLAAGGRRFLALLHAKKTKVMVRIYPPNISDETIKTIEKLENVYRKDMTWQEIALLDKQIHTIQQSKYGEKISTAKNATGWSQADTSKLMGKSQASISRSLKLADALETHKEELKNVKDRKGAERLIKRLEHNQEQAKKAKALRAASVDDNTIRAALEKCYIIEDCLTGIKKLPADTFDLIEIDPPYAIDYDILAKSDSSVFEYNEISADKYMPFISELLKECYRVAKPNAWLIQWFAIDPWYSQMLSALRAANWQTKGLPAIWAKLNSPASTMQPEKYLGRNWEPFFYARKGEPILNRRGRADVYYYQSPPSQQRIHPTERPVPMMEDILSTFASPGSSILCPFLGSGNTILAACNLTMQCIGYDLSQEYKDKFTVRIHEQTPGQYGKET